METSRLAISAKTTVRARSEKTCPATPSTNTMGKNTATVVSVEAITAVPTSEVPRATARFSVSPSSLQRAIDSTTTIPESTSIPIPRARPPRLIMFSVRPVRFIGANTAATETGIATEITAVVLKSLRNRYRTRIASSPPSTAVLMTSSTEARMNVLRSETISRVQPSGSFS